MTDWTAFAGFAGVVLALLLLLSRASQPVVRQAVDASADDIDAEHHVAADHGDASFAASPSAPTPAAAGASVPDLPPGALLANVAVSQALFASLLVAGTWLTGVPLAALGLASVGPRAVVVGVALGVALYALNEVGAELGEEWGLGRSEELREALAPSTARGWVVLLAVVLPLVAVFEELLFRGVLVGALAAGFGVSPWLLAVVSSLAFALGHGVQGPAGIAVTGLLGFVLAATFVLTGSLVAVVVAHYLVNTLEFVVHET